MGDRHLILGHGLDRQVFKQLVRHFGLLYLLRRLLLLREVLLGELLGRIFVVDPRAGTHGVPSHVLVVGQSLAVRCVVVGEGGRQTARVRLLVNADVLRLAHRVEVELLGGVVLYHRQVVLLVLLYVRLKHLATVDQGRLRRVARGGHDLRLLLELVTLDSTVHLLA